MRTVAIVGAGEIGGAAARALAARDAVGRVLLVDAAGHVAAGKALDIQQSAPVDIFHTRLDGTSDDSSVAGCSLCIVADRFGSVPGEWRGDEGCALISRLVRYLGDAPIVFAGAHQSDLIGQAAGELRVARRRLIGSSATALASAVASIVALEARSSPGEVALTVLGRPPAGFVVPWSEASIGGCALDRVLSQAQRARVEARTARLWPPGPYALGTAAATVAAALLAASRRAYSVLTWLEGEFGVRRTVGALPVRLDGQGIAESWVPALGPREQVQIQTALGG
jgi:malate dehydrogenase